MVVLDVLAAECVVDVAAFLTELKLLVVLLTATGATLTAAVDLATVFVEDAKTVELALDDEMAAERAVDDETAETAADVPCNTAVGAFGF